MRMYDLIERKKRGGALSEEEIRYMVRGFVDGSIPDYQMAAMLMAIYFQGMNDGEIAYLTLEMARSDVYKRQPMTRAACPSRSATRLQPLTTSSTCPCSRGTARPPSPAP